MNPSRRNKSKLPIGTLWLAIAFALTGPRLVRADDKDPCQEVADTGAIGQLAEVAEQVQKIVIANPGPIFPSLPAAVVQKASSVTPVKMVPTNDHKIPEFPSYSACEKSYFRVATLSPEVDKVIDEKGWMSGWQRRAEELKKNGAEPNDALFDALSPSRPFEERIIQYVRVKGVPSQFPKHSSVVGVMDDPIRVLSVGYHTGYDAGMRGAHLRLDEIEVGECARSRECKSIQARDTTKVFEERGLKPRYSTANEWAIDGGIPKSCIVATYRIKFQKVDDKCYSDANGNCSFGK